jgi:hypothetical protein
MILNGHIDYEYRDELQEMVENLYGIYLSPSEVEELDQIIQSDC